MVHLRKSISCSEQYFKNPIDSSANRLCMCASNIFIWERDTIYIYKYIYIYIYTYVYICVITFTDRLFRWITTLQCG